jgi:hypothetical protein
MAIGPRPRPRRSRRIAAGVGLALAGAAAAAAVVWAALGDDRDLADSYRETLAVANGEYFDASRLDAPGGKAAGYVYGYQGRASWVLAVVYDAVPAGRYELEAVTADGRHLPVRELTVAGDEGSAGGVIDADYHEVTELRLLDTQGREVADAEVGEG